MKPINTSIYDFPTLITGGYVYVDKTAVLYELAKPGADMLYYLPRPRRFGKSLMISTLKALFQGRRELFRGLKIEQADWNWEKEVYPVLHLDMSKASASSLADFLLTAEETATELFADETGARFALLLKTAFAKIPHEWLAKDEKEVKHFFLAFMVFARAEVNSEEQHSLGRPDSAVKTEKAIYVVEFKYAGSADAALAQCREKRYADAYAADGRRVIYVGVNYDPAARTTGEVKTAIA